MSVVSSTQLWQLYARHILHFLNPPSCWKGVIEVWERTYCPQPSTSSTALKRSYYSVPDTFFRAYDLTLRTPNRPRQLLSYPFLHSLVSICIWLDLFPAGPGGFRLPCHNSNHGSPKPNTPPFSTHLLESKQAAVDVGSFFVGRLI